MRLVSLNCGPAAEIAVTGTDEWWDKPWRTGFIKRPHLGLLTLGLTGLAGDEQGNLVHHGGVDKAVCVYPTEHYEYWRKILHLPELSHGAFGENFTTLGLTEQEVCIGDVFQVGSATVQISQPRQPCWKLARRWRIKDLAAQVERAGYTGWYLRVLTPGIVRVGEILFLQQRPHPEWPVSLANEIMHQSKPDLSATADLATCPALSESWQRSLSALASGRLPESDAVRINPPVA